jgi:hypothetical protein
VEKYGTARQATDHNIIRRMRIACCITTATDTLRICNTYCFSTATMVTRTRLNVTSYAHYPSVRNVQTGSEPHTQPPIQWTPLELPPGDKWPVSQANYSPPTQYRGYELVEPCLHSPFFMTSYLSTGAYIPSPLSNLIK